MLTSSPLRGAIDMEKRTGRGGCSAHNCAGVWGNQSWRGKVSGVLTSSPLRGAVDMEQGTGRGGCSAPNYAGVTVGNHSCRGKVQGVLTS